MMFEKYMKERQSAECFKNESGFIFYRIQDKECFIVDMFIEPEKRKSGALQKLIAELEFIAEKWACKFISGNIYLNDPGCNRTLNASFKVGFKAVAANNNIIFIVKEL